MYRFSVNYLSRLFVVQQRCNARCHHADVEDGAQQLLDVVLTNNNNLLERLLLQRSLASQKYNIRQRLNDCESPVKITHLNGCYFINGNSYFNLH